MKEKLQALVEEILQTRWPGQYALGNLCIQEYGVSLIFTNLKNQHHFSPTIFSNQLLIDLLVKGLSSARAEMEKEIETAFVKEKISGW